MKEKRKKELERNPSSDALGGVVQMIPDSAMKSIDKQVEEAGGEWQESPEYEGSIGQTMFDTPASEDGTVTVLLPKDNIEALPRQSLVRIKSISDGRYYLGAVVKGPFAEPDGLRADSPILVNTTVRGGFLLPKYHGRTQVEIIGEELDDGGIVPPRRRPLPNSPVFALTPEESTAVLGTQGDIMLGLAHMHEDIEVKVPSDRKSVFPRHLGILGTTGGGKSTTVSGLIAQLQKSGVATILLDTEGEYTAICEPTDDAHMKLALKRRGMEPEAVENTYVYCLVGRETANADHPRARNFSLLFSELSPYAVMEILELNDAQQERFLKAYDATKLTLDRLTIYPSNEKERDALIELDEFESGYPRMTLTHLYDMVKVIASHVAKEGDPFVETREFYQNMEVLKRCIAQISPPSNIASWRVLQGRLGRIKRIRIFDREEVPPLNYEELLEPSRVSIIDLNDTDSPHLNNLVIAQILKGIERQQEKNYDAATVAKKDPTTAMVFIEEAHEFLSAKRIKDMQVLFLQVARIARRGRKKRLGLVFITQLPQHLPDEVFGLINNWVVHKVSDSNVVSRLRRSIGGIDDALWKQLPGLAPGQAIVSFTSLTRPLLAAIDPTPCRLLMVE